MNKLQWRWIHAVSGRNVRIVELSPHNDCVIACW